MRDTRPTASTFVSTSLHNSSSTQLFESQLYQTQPLLLSTIDHNISNNNMTTQSPPSSPEKDPATEASGPPSPPVPPALPMEGSLTQDMRLAVDSQEEEDVDENGFTVSSNNNDSDNVRQNLVDFADWWAYQIILAHNQKQGQKAQKEFDEAMERLAAASAPFQFQKMNQAGRLFSRIQLAGLALDVLCLPRDASSDHWKMVREQLVLMKSRLLRQDANRDMLLLMEEEERDNTTTTPHNSQRQAAAPNTQLEPHVLFQQEYRRVGRLLKVQQVLCEFQFSLSKIADNKLQSAARRKKAVQQAIDAYERGIRSVFPYSVPTASTSSEEEDEEARMDDTTSVQSFVSDHPISPTSREHTTPHDLVSFLLKDLYQPASSANNNNGNASPSSHSSHDEPATKHNLAQRLLKDVSKVINGRSDFSFTSTQSALLELLQNWQALVLELPTLAQLGYGGSSASNHNNKTKSIQQQLAEAGEDAMLSSMEEEDQQEQRRHQTSTSSSPERKRKASQEPTDSPPTKKRHVQAFGESDDDDDGSSEDDDTQGKKKKKRRRVAHKKNHKNKIPFLPDDVQQHHVVITDAMMRAIENGVDKYGRGRWWMIKEEDEEGVLQGLSPHLIEKAYCQMVQFDM